MQTIPLTNDFAQTLTTVLNNQEVQLRVWYQTIGNGWFFSMQMGSVSIVEAYRINNGSPILKSIASDFIGDILCIPSTDEGAEPEADAPWGNTHTLVYMTPEELEETGVYAS